MVGSYQIYRGKIFCRSTGSSITVPPNCTLMQLLKSWSQCRPCWFYWLPCLGWLTVTSTIITVRNSKYVSLDNIHPIILRHQHLWIFVFYFVQWYFVNLRTLSKLVFRMSFGSLHSQLDVFWTISSTQVVKNTQHK